jgi:transposase
MHSAHEAKAHDKLCGLPPAHDDPGVGQLTALAFVAAIDDPSRIRRSRDIGAYLGLVPRRYQSGEVDNVGGISKCGDRRVRTLLYEAANVMLTRYKGQLQLKDWGVIEGSAAFSLNLGL